MTTAIAELPDDVDALKAMILAMAAQKAQLEARNSDLEITNSRLEITNSHLTITNKAADERIAALTSIVKMLERSLWHALGAAARHGLERRPACLRVR